MTMLARLVRSLLGLLAGGLLGFFCSFAGIVLARHWGWRVDGYGGLVLYGILFIGTILGAVVGGLSVWLRRVGPSLGVAAPLAFAIWMAVLGLKRADMPIFVGILLGLFGTGLSAGLAGRYLGVVGVRATPPDVPDEMPPPMAFLVEESERITASRPLPPPGNLSCRARSEDPF